MGKNHYIQQRDADRQKFFQAGETLGRQTLLDMMCLALSDYKIMGNKKLKPEELAKVALATSQLLDYFFACFELKDETDYKQEELDKCLKEVVPEELFYPFKERYPMLKEFDYIKGKWK